MAVVGAITVRFNGRPAVTVTDFDDGVDRPAQVKAGGYGVIGTSTGVETGQGTFTMAPRQENGIEFPIDVLRQPFTMNYPMGTQRFALIGCTMTSMKRSTKQKEGDTSFVVSFVYEALKQTQ